MARLTSLWTMRSLPSTDELRYGYSRSADDSALAMNGAEVLYRASFPHRSSDAYAVQTRARALDNNLYVIAPNVGTYYLTPEDHAPIDTIGTIATGIATMSARAGKTTRPPIRSVIMPIGSRANDPRSTGTLTRNAT